MLEPTALDPTITVIRKDTNTTVTTPSTTNVKTYSITNLQPGLTTVTIKVDTVQKRKTYTIHFGRAVSDAFGWTSHLDFNTLRSSDHSFINPIAATTDGTTVWIAYSGTNKLLAYSSSTGDRLQNDDITLQGLTEPIDIHYRDRTLWAITSTKAFAFNTFGTEDTTRTITLYAGNSSPSAVWSNDTTIWVADVYDRRIYAYDLTTGTRDTTSEFTSVTSYLAGIFSDGFTMWALNSSTKAIYAYSMETKGRQSADDFNTLRATRNLAPKGLFADGSTLFVPDTTNNKLYAYNLPALSDDTGIKSFTVNGLQYADGQSNVIPADIGEIPVTITPNHQHATVELKKMNGSMDIYHFSSGTTIEFNSATGAYLVDLNTTRTYLQVEVTAADPTYTDIHEYLIQRPVMASNSTHLYGFEIVTTEGTEIINGVYHAVPNSITEGTIRPILHSTTATTTITPADTDSNAANHQTSFNVGRNNFKVTVSDNDQDDKIYYIVISRADNTTTWDPTQDVNDHKRHPK